MAEYAHLSKPSEEWLEYASKSSPPVLNGSPVELRQMLSIMKKNMNEKTEMPTDELESGAITIPSRADHRIPVRWYAPKGKSNLPVVVLFHGGGFVMGDLENEEVSSRFIARDCAALVFNVEYRLAPEHPFPAGLEDAYDAVRWVATNANELLGSPETGFVVGGFSAGSSFATVCAQLARDEGLQPPITGQLLSLPSTLHHSVYPEKWRSELLSYQQNSNAPVINAKSIEIFEPLYACPDWADPWASPALHPNLEDLPKAYFQITGLDPLRDEGFLYARLLRENGAKTKVDVYPGLPHTFWTFPGLKSSKKWIQDTIAGVLWLLDGDEVRL
ncbi:Alpha/Beta hydrolase protein [Paraphoma chrysanthemicola]|nr:Alpha/Beta hydrolase protein [Paraphoma chrysanthemicola]